LFRRVPDHGGLVVQLSSGEGESHFFTVERDTPSAAAVRS
jgi:hypothetical protein